MWTVGINLLVMVLYVVIFRFSGINNQEMGGIIAAAFVIGFHVIICLVVSFVFVFTPSYKHLAGIWLLSALAILLIGFSTCLGAFTIRI